MTCPRCKCEECRRVELRAVLARHVPRETVPRDLPIVEAHNRHTLRQIIERDAWRDTWMGEPV